MIWVGLVLVLVCAVKYYTAFRMSKLERRLRNVKLELQDAKSRMLAAKKKKEDAGELVDEYILRHTHMKKIIDDIKIRLSEIGRIERGELSEEEKVAQESQQTPYTKRGRK